MINYKLVNKSDFVINSDENKLFVADDKIKQLSNDLDNDVDVTFEVTHQNAGYFLTYKTEIEGQEFSGGVQLERNSPRNNEIILQNGFRHLEKQLKDIMRHLILNRVVDSKNHTRKGEEVYSTQLGVNNDENEKLIKQDKANAKKSQNKINPVENKGIKDVYNQQSGKEVTGTDIPLNELDKISNEFVSGSSNTVAELDHPINLNEATQSKVEGKTSKASKNSK